MNLLHADAKGSPGAGLDWLHAPAAWRREAEGLVVEAAPSTDFFRPLDGPAVDNAALLSRTVEGDFTAAAHLGVEPGAFGDAAALTVRAGPAQWAKLCIERSPFGEVSIVSVVTDPWSDDAGGERLPAPACRLRLTRAGRVFGMHYSLDGERWRFVRMFAMEAPAALCVGVHVQAPHSDGCRAVFRTLTLAPEPVADFRSGA